jgi:hypothetical protein
MDYGGIESPNELNGSLTVTQPLDSWKFVAQMKLMSSELHQFVD